MSVNLDKTLDQVIASNRHTRRRTGRRSTVKSPAKASLVGSSGTATAKAVKKAKVVETKTTSNAPPKAEKIIVSNLPPDVNEAQIKELFNSQIGPTKEVTLSHDASGRSKGIASVVFTKTGHGTKAYEMYNGRLIDGKQPMKVEIVLDPSKPLPLSQRVSAAAPANAKTTKTPMKTKKVRRGRTLRKKGSDTKRPTKTAEDLDAEMVDYAAGAQNVATSS